MNVEVVAGDHLGNVAASHVAARLREAVERRESATLALSGGSTPAAMFAALARQDVPWRSVHVVQVDERIAPDGDDARNLTALRHDLLDHLPEPPAGIHPMPAVEANEPGPAARRAAASYAATLRQLAGTPPVLDVIHLGLGDDGHTASLVPNDPVLDVTDRPVAVTGSYRGHRRLTLTFPALADARNLLWLVTGADKRNALRRWQAGDPELPASRVPTDRALLITDPAAAGWT